LPPPLAIGENGVDLSKRPLVQQRQRLARASASHDGDIFAAPLKKPGIAIGHSTHAQNNVGIQPSNFPK